MFKNQPQEQETLEPELSKESKWWHLESDRMNIPPKDNHIAPIVHQNIPNHTVHLSH
jgi:hypothetical protein